MYAADMALKTAMKGVPPYGLLGAEDVSEAFAGTAKIGDAQRSIMIAPWNDSGWEVIGAVASRN